MFFRVIKIIKLEFFSNFSPTYFVRVKHQQKDILKGILKYGIT